MKTLLLLLLPLSCFSQRDTTNRISLSGDVVAGWPTVSVYWPKSDTLPKKNKPVKPKDSVRKELHIYGVPDGTPWNQFNHIDSIISDTIPYDAEYINPNNVIVGWYTNDTLPCNKCWPAIRTPPYPDTVYSKTGELLAIMQYNEKHEQVGYLLEQTHKILAVETRDTSKATILIDTDLPCGAGCFITGSVKAWRVTVHVPFQKLESDFFVEKHDQIYYYDQNWKRIKKYYPTPIKEGW